jgi:succinate-semialdehyde dehydrogenase / glutarate-semialdehyde dehydrogenase
MHGLESINPATGESLARYSAMDGDEVERRLNAAAERAQIRRRATIEERTARLRPLAAALRRRSESLAQLMTAEMGKPISQSRAEVEKSAVLCDYVADHAPRLLADIPARVPEARVYTHFTPLGTVFAIMPWNFPLWQVLRAAVPAIAAGNVVLFKHAANVTGCALAIEELASEAELPPGTLSALLLGHEEVERVLEDERVDAATLTGSTSAGRAVARAAGEGLKKIVLELGGSDPYIVLADADVEHAARCCVDSRVQNSGQSCIAAKRWIVESAVAPRFERAALQYMRSLHVGDPRREDTHVGPLARADLRDRLQTQVEATLKAGARVVTGGHPLDGPGWFYAPTILADVPPGSPAYAEELFGPVAALFTAIDAEGALRIANDTSYGLGAAIFTADPVRGERLARDVLRAGNVFVNCAVRSDPRAPFGGIGHSGHGRELGVLGIREFCNAKTVWVCRS